MKGKRKTGIEFVMICTVHNIKKIADFIKREGENLKDMLKMIVGGGSKDWNKRGSQQQPDNCRKVSCSRLYAS
jgi:transposase